MKASETKLQRVIEGTNQFVVPLFQRPYSWDTKEWTVLWDDLVELYCMRKKIRELTSSTQSSQCRKSFFPRKSNACASSTPMKSRGLSAGAVRGMFAPPRDLRAGEHLEWQDLHPPCSAAPGDSATRLNFITSGSPVPLKPSPACVNASNWAVTDVPTADIRRRFNRSLVHLIEDYLPLSTRWTIWDSRGLPAKRLANSPTHDIEAVRKLIGV